MVELQQVSIQNILIRIIVDFDIPEVKEGSASIGVFYQTFGSRESVYMAAFSFPSLDFQCQKEFADLDTDVTSLFYDGKYDSSILVTGHTDGNLRLWNVESGDMVHKIPVSTGSLNHLVIREFEDRLGLAGKCDVKSVRQFVVGDATLGEAGVAEFSALNTLLMAQSIPNAKLPNQQIIHKIENISAVTYGVYHSLLFALTKDGRFVISEIESGNELFSWKVVDEDVGSKSRFLMFTGKRYEEILLSLGTKLYRIGKFVKAEKNTDMIVASG
ncbi:hypothetical protein BKA69DRAFT_692302 [Paraphysoderma sedebokerense]|nr:hypothetical protein BKA69DRAFT_692302 [Paraphysoderma sedebokerense]